MGDLLERLREIREYLRGDGHELIPEEDIDVLVQASHRIQGLEADLSVYRNKEALKAKRIADLKAENERLREALRFACEDAVSGNYPDITDPDAYMASLLSEDK